MYIETTLSDHVTLTTVYLYFRNVPHFRTHYILPEGMVFYLRAVWTRDVYASFLKPDLFLTQHCNNKT